MIRLEGAETIASYDSDWIKDTPAVTAHSYKAGKALLCWDGARVQMGE